MRLALEFAVPVRRDEQDRDLSRASGERSAIADGGAEVLKCAPELGGEEERVEGSAQRAVGPRQREMLRSLRARTTRDRLEKLSLRGRERARLERLNTTLHRLLLAVAGGGMPTRI